MKRTLEDLQTLFGIRYVEGEDGSIQPPPPKSLAVLLDAAIRRDRPASAHGPRAQRRRAKTARRRRLTRRLQRTTWKRHFEQVKKEAS